jgi:2-methylisocitrate lyase-like PEP mutase family enzyme
MRMAAFAALHSRGEPLVLANAWDAASARIVEAAGFPAIATSSAAMANALGYADGERLDVDELMAAVRRIARVVDVFVSVDAEAGYADEIDDMLKVVARLHAAGAVGVNIEDWNPRTGALFPLGIAQGRVAAVKARFGDALFVNARTDVYLHQVGAAEERFATVTARLAAFAQAGADGAFVPGVHDAETIGRLAEASSKPLNILAGAATPPVAELARLGVARVSTGSSPMRHAMASLRAVARELREAGTFGYAAPERALSYAEMNALFQR